MRLLSLELHGFKSFPDKTLLKFAPGVTSVVGPNGSGKSNISDAIRWVLGEISSKNMRGSKMDDVIFSGSDTRKPMNFAEVSLTMDNREENGFARMPIDYDEVTITRRITRSTEKGGGSDYFINRQPSRLKDINALFMNTGIGRDGYSIVSQGKAAEIISQKSDERRNVFEEAAGISKYRYDKNEAEKKLAETTLNCERLADILAEKKRALKKLESDSERAKQFLEVFEKKKEADVSLAVYDIRSIQIKLTDIQNKYETARTALLSVDNSISDAEAERERIELLQAQAKELYARLSTEIEELNKNKYSQDTNAQVLKNEVEHMRARIAEYTSEIDELNANLKEHVTRVNTAIDSLKAITDKRDEAESRRGAINRKLEELDVALENCDSKIEDNLSKTDAAQERQVNSRVRIAEIEGTARSSEDRKTEITKQLETTSESVAKCAEELKRHKDKMDNYQSQSDKIRSQETELSSTISSLQQSISDYNSRISLLASDLRDIRTRTDNLRRMEELFEGYPKSVSAIMNAAKNGALSGICGPISHIFTVKTQYSTAIETALASTLQNIVCEDANAAEAAIKWLTDNKAGYTTFYPLNTVQVTPLQVNANSLKSVRGYVGIASELVEYDVKYDRVIKHLLGRTLVFDNIRNAKEYAHSIGHKIRIVTLDGNQINAGGSYAGGFKAKGSGVLNRGAEIDRLNAERIKAETEKNTVQSKLDKATHELNEAFKTADSVTAKLKLLNTMYQAESTQYAAYEAQMNTMAENETQLREQLTDIENAGAKLEEEKNALVLTISETEKTIERLSVELEALNEEKKSVNDSIHTENNRLNAVSMEIVGLNKDVESATNDLEFKKKQHQDCESAISNKKKNISDLERSIDSTEKNIAESSSKVLEMDTELTTKTAERDKANSDSIIYEQKLSKLNLNLQEIMRSREVLSNDHTKLEAQKNNMDTELMRLVNHLSEEYNLTFSEAETLNYPPVTTENRSEIEKQLNEYKNKLRGIGSVDTGSIEEYKIAKVDYDDLSNNFDDMEKSRVYYNDTVNQLEENMRNRFVEVIGEINEAFQRAFSELFGGGRAEVVLTDMDDVLHCGIDINVAPPGKIIKSLSLLSGGEQAFISIALVFALLHVNPSPFCIFDEIEAALDEVNVAMFANYIKKYSDHTQFITITHRRGTMEVGDTLYGVTMAERGISRVLAINVSDVETKLGIKL